MRLTQFTDYSLRVLLYLAERRDTLVTVREIADAYGLSTEHLRKVVQHLGGQGLIRSVRGVGGGLALAREPETIVIGRVVRDSEHMELLPCDGGEGEAGCPLTACRLRGLVDQALMAFLRVLDGKTLADLIPPSR